jgi:hypothetical protein
MLNKEPTVYVRLPCKGRSLMALGSKRSILDRSKLLYSQVMALVQEDETGCLLETKEKLLRF